MPTGYTAQIEDGRITNAKDFLLLCTRAFGVAIDIKDEPLSTPTPMEFEPDEYYKINLQRREQELEESNQMTIDEFIEREKHSMQRSAEFAREHIKEMKSANKRYLRIREVISKWNPPTTSHEGLKEFALEQIDKSIYSEDYFSWSEKIIERSNTVRSQEEWNDLFDEYIKAAEEDVKRAKKHYDDAVELALHKRILIKEKATIIHDELICNVKMTELEIFAKFTNEHGGEWWLLEKCGKYSLYMSKGKHLGNDCHRYFTTPVYQIFKDGKRIYTNTNYCEASCIFNDLMKENDI